MLPTEHRTRRCRSGTATSMSQPTADAQLFASPMSGHLLVVNADGPETRVALIENGLLAELYIERKRERGIVGNIYKGRVVRVLPGMHAAFVDIGIEKAAFLYVADVRGGGDYKSLF